jgi:hypothetical protein
MRTTGSRSPLRRAALGLLLAVMVLAAAGKILTTAPAALPWLAAGAAVAAAYTAGYRRGSARRPQGPGPRPTASPRGPGVPVKGRPRRSRARIARDLAGLLLRR